MTDPGTDERDDAPEGEGGVTQTAVTPSNTADPERRTRTTMTLTLEADGFVGLRQAQAAADGAARQLRGVLPYDVRVSTDSPVTTTFSDNGQEHTDIATASQLPTPEGAGAITLAQAPQPTPAPTPVAPLGVEAQRGGLPDSNLSMNEPTEPTPGIGGVVTTSPQDVAPTPYDAGAGGPGRVEEGASVPANTDYGDMTVAELRTAASERGIEGRSEMNKAELVAALEESDNEA